MSEAILGALIGAAAALAGSTVTWLLEARRRTQDRDRDTTDALLAQRAAAYRGFTNAVLVTANEMHKAAVDVPGSLETRRAAASLLNRNVTGAILELELIAEPTTYALARDVRDVMLDYRNLVLDGSSSEGAAWAAIGPRYLSARAAFQRQARRDPWRSGSAAP